MEKQQVWTADDASRWEDTKGLIACNEPFFAYMCYQLKEVFLEEIPTLATDGTHIFVNRDFVKKHIRLEQAIFRLHEVGHVVLKHTLKIAPGGEWENWDRPTMLQAMDHVLNLWLKKSTSAWLQASVWDGLVAKTGMLCDARFEGMTTPQVYEVLIQEARKNPKPKPGKGDAGGTIPGHSGGTCCKPQKGETGEELSPAEAEEMNQKIDSWIVRAAEMAKSCGKVPAGMDRMVEEIIRPQENYLDRLRRLFSGCIPQDYSWARPKKNLIHRGLYLPTVSKTGTGRIAFAVDTSGSMMKEELALAWGTISELCETTPPEKLWMVFCDSEAHAEEVEPYDALDFKAVGGGGTDFDPVFAWAQDQGLDALIYFTDLECSASHIPDPGYPVIWLHTRPKSDDRSCYPTFGDFIEVKPIKS